MPPTRRVAYSENRDSRSGCRADDVERPGLRIASPSASHTSIVGSTRVDCRRPDRVAGLDTKHWRRGGAKPIVERGRRELVKMAHPLLGRPSRSLSTRP